MSRFKFTTKEIMEGWRDNFEIENGQCLGAREILKYMHSINSNLTKKENAKARHSIELILTSAKRWLMVEDSRDLEKTASFLMNVCEIFYMQNDVIIFSFSEIRMLIRLVSRLLSKF